MDFREQVKQVLADPTNLPPEFLNYLLQHAAMNPTPLGRVTAPANVVQATSKSTAVTMNRSPGQVTMNGAALAGGATVSFVVNNSAVGANDCVAANIVGPSGTSGNYSMSAPHVASGGGAFRLFVTNTSGGSLSDALVISFAVVKAAVIS